MLRSKQNEKFFLFIEDFDQKQIDEILNHTGSIDIEKYIDGSMLKITKYLRHFPSRAETVLNALAKLVDKDGNSFLIWAIKSFSASHRGFELIKLWIDAGSDVNLTNKNGDTPLSLTCKIDPNYQLIEYLILSDANLNTRDKDGRTLLFNFCKLSLLQKTSNPSGKDNLHKIIRVLLLNHAKVDEEIDEIEPEIKDILREDKAQLIKNLGGLKNIFNLVVKWGGIRKTFDYLPEGNQLQIKAAATCFMLFGKKNKSLRIPKPIQNMIFNFSI